MLPVTSFSYLQPVDVFFGVAPSRSLYSSYLNTLNIMQNKWLCFLTEFEFTIMALNASKNSEKAGSLYAWQCTTGSIDRLQIRKLSQKRTWNEICEGNSLYACCHPQEYLPVNQLTADEVDALWGRRNSIFDTLVSQRLSLRNCIASTRVNAHPKFWWV